MLILGLILIFKCDLILILMLFELERPQDTPDAAQDELLHRVQELRGHLPGLLAGELHRRERRLGR